MCVCVGIPSAPVIINVVGGAGTATLTLRVDQFGVVSPSDFIFIVSVFYQGSTETPIAMRMISPDSIDSGEVVIEVENLPQGMLVFTVASSNQFGSPSATTDVSSPADVQPGRLGEAQCSWIVACMVIY